MKHLLSILILLGFVTVAVAEEVETRIDGFEDNAQAAWFTFEYSKDDIFTLAFATVGPGAGIWITEGPLLATGETTCFIDIDDPELKVLLSKFVNLYGINPSPIEVEANTIGFNNMISDPVLVYFLKEAQSQTSSVGYYKQLGC